MGLSLNRWIGSMPAWIAGSLWRRTRTVTWRPLRGHAHATVALLVCTVIGLVTGLPAVAATYSVSSTSYNWVSTGSETRITSWASGLGCPDTNGEDSISATINIGFSFQFGTTSYTQLRVFTNGRLQFNNTRCYFGTQSVGPPRTYPDPMPSANTNNTMRIYGADLDSAAGGAIRYGTTGSAPNRIFYVNWEALPQWSAAGTSYSLQVQLHENGDFYFMYGAIDDIANGSATGVGPAQVGWQLSTTDYAIVQNGPPGSNTGLRFSRQNLPSAFRLSYSAAGLYCLDHAVTITAINAAGTPITGYNGTMNLSTTTARGSWLLSSGSGTLTDPVSDDGAASYRWSTSESSITLLLRYRAGAATIKVDAVDSNTTSVADDETQGSVVFAPSGFTVTSSALSNPPPGSIPVFTLAQTAGSSVPVHITAYGQTPTDPTCGIITTYTGAKNLAFWSTYVNPASGTRSATINGTSIATAEGSAVAQSVTFTAGQAVATLKYKDAGLVTLGMKESGTSIRGATGNIAMRPADFVITNIRRADNGVANPGASAVNDTVFLPAGHAFSATVTAYDAEGSATPNFGRESPAESVTLAPSLVLPAGGRVATIAQPTGFTGFSNGRATGTDFAWPEVGIIRLVPSISDADYLGAGNVTGTTSGNVGRFVPDHFTTVLNTPLFGTACVAGGYTYLGQPFVYTVAPEITVTAVAADGSTTQNYAGAFFRLTNGSLTGRQYTTTTGALDTSGLPATTADPAIASSGSGVGTLTFSAGTGIAFTRSTPVVPFDAVVRLAINVIDADGVAATNPVTFGAASGIGFSAGATQRYGRLAFRNGVSSELLDLPLLLRTEYYAGASGFRRNTEDSCTTGITLSLSDFKGSLGAGETCVRDSGSPGTSGAGCAAPSPVGLQFRSVAGGGDFNLTLAAPGSGNSGSVTVDATAPVWLRFPWHAPGTFANPAGTAAFGLFPGSPQQIYQREVL